MMGDLRKVCFLGTGIRNSTSTVHIRRRPDLHVSRGGDAVHQNHRHHPNLSTNIINDLNPQLYGTHHKAAMIISEQMSR